MLSLLIRQFYSDFGAYKAHTFCFCSQTANLALKKPTAQSSTYNNDGKSENAVDGVRNIDWNVPIGLRCTHTNWNNPAWWQVDLGPDHVQISDVFIITLLTGHHPRSEYLKITLGKYGKYSSLKLKHWSIKSFSRGNPIMYRQACQACSS